MDELYNIAITPDENSDLNYIMSKGEMIIGIDENTPPMSYYDNDGELIGFNIEMAKAICLNLGIDVKFKTIEWDKKETELNNKNIDCLWNSLAVTEERQKNIDFSHVYLTNKQVIVIRTSDASKFTNTKSLSNAKISAGQGTTGEEALKANEYFSKAQYTSSSSQNEAIQALKRGEFDAIIIDYTLAKGNIDNGNTDLTIIEGISLREEQFAVGFRVGSDMVKKISNMILDMIMDDTLFSIAKNYNLVDLFSSLRITDSGYIMNNGKMIIGFEAGFPPICYYDKNGELIGFDIDFAKALCQRLGIEAEFVPIDWDQKMVLIKERSIDCIWSGLSVVEEYREYIKYSRVYLSNKQVVVIKRSNASKYFTKSFWSKTFS